MTDIYIVRHGNTFDTGDVVTRVGAKTDLPLSKSGQIQADALAAHFQTQVPDGFAHAYCSPLIRTRQTAEAILKPYAGDCPLQTLEFLREVDYGPDENQPEYAVIARLGAAALKAWDEDAVPPPGWKIDPVQLKRDWADRIKDLASQRGPVLIVTSNGIARFVLDAVTSVETELGSIKLKTGAYGLIRAEADRVSLLEWNIRP